MLLQSICFVVFIVTLVGVVRPFRGYKRWQFGAASLAAFIGFNMAAPPPTPAQLAARRAEDKRKAEIAADGQSDEHKTDHRNVVEKGSEAVAALTPYTRSEYRQTFARVGASTFARLASLERGAVWAAAESRNCDRVRSAMVSERSSLGKALWFADCANGKRFMISQQQAEAALERLKREALAFSDLEESCTTSDVARCKLSPLQRTFAKNEVMFVSKCDFMLQDALSDPSSLDTGQWTTSFGKGDMVTFRRPFDGQNALGLMVRARYRCDVDASSGEVTRFEVQGPTGTTRLL